MGLEQEQGQEQDQEQGQEQGQDLRREEKFLS